MRNPACVLSYTHTRFLSPMPLSRRRFIARTAVAAAALPFVPLARAAAPRPTLQPIRRGVGYVTGRGGTIGYLRSADALVAVDAQFPDSAQAVLDALRDGTDRRLDLLVNTHHHADHTSGNTVLAPAADRHVAHVAVPGLQRAAAVRSGAYDTQAYPRETFDGTWRADVGDETVALHYFGPAHTAGDAVVHFERADVVHMGDLVFHRRQPFVDGAGGASVTRWIALLETVHGRFSDTTAFVFGHAADGLAPTGTRADLLAMRDFLTALVAAVQARLAAGDAPPALDGLIVPGFDAWGPTPMRVIEPVAAELTR